MYRIIQYGRKPDMIFFITVRFLPHRMQTPTHARGGGGISGHRRATERAHNMPGTSKCNQKACSPACPTLKLGLFAPGTSSYTKCQAASHSLERETDRQPGRPGAASQLPLPAIGAASTVQFSSCTRVRQRAAYIS